MSWTEVFKISCVTSSPEIALHHNKFLSSPTEVYLFIYYFPFLNRILSLSLCAICSSPLMSVLVWICRWKHWLLGQFSHLQESVSACRPALPLDLHCITWSSIRDAPALQLYMTWYIEPIKVSAREVEGIPLSSTTDTTFCTFHLQAMVKPSLSDEFVAADCLCFSQSGLSTHWHLQSTVIPASLHGYPIVDFCALYDTG